MTKHLAYGRVFLGRLRSFLSVSRIPFVLVTLKIIQCAFAQNWEALTVKILYSRANDYFVDVDRKYLA